MKTICSWKTRVVAAFLAASAVIYVIHYLIFRDVHHIFLYMIGDLGFLFIDILVVIFFIEKLLERREKTSRMNKLNMVIGTFFSELGVELLKSFTLLVKNADELRGRTAAQADWSRQDFERARRAAKTFPYEVDPDPELLCRLKAFLDSKRPFLLSLLENPNVLEHERFTDLLWAVFHLSEELGYRPENIAGLPESDRLHLAVDLRRPYSLLVGEWITYTEHLKDNYPYLFSLAARINPLSSSSSAVISDDPRAA